MDNCTAHLSEETKSLLQNENIHVAFLAPHSSHLTQPLDLVIFHAHKQIMRGCKFNDSDDESDYVRKLTKIISSWQAATTKHNIMEAFKQAGCVYTVGGETITRVHFSYDAFINRKCSPIKRTKTKDIKEEAEPITPEKAIDGLHEILKKRIPIKEFNQNLVEQLKEVRAECALLLKTNSPAHNILLCLEYDDTAPKCITSPTSPRKNPTISELNSDYMKLSYEERLNLELQSIGLVV